VNNFIVTTMAVIKRFSLNITVQSRGSLTGGSLFIFNSRLTLIVT